MPSSASDAGAVALEGSESIPSTPVRLIELLMLEPVVAAPFCVLLVCVPLAPPRLLKVVGEPTPPGAVHALVRSPAGDGPADASAPRHVDAEGVPAVPVLFDPFAA